MTIERAAIMPIRRNYSAYILYLASDGPQHSALSPM